jgi:hypothetical protein
MEELQREFQREWAAIFGKHEERLENIRKCGVEIMVTLGLKESQMRPIKTVILLAAAGSREFYAEVDPNNVSYKGVAERAIKVWGLFATNDAPTIWVQLSRIKISDGDMKREFLNNYEVELPKSKPMTFQQLVQAQTELLNQIPSEFWEFFKFVFEEKEIDPNKPFAEQYFKQNKEAIQKFIAALEIHG